jgi:hypothetical protein
MAEANEKEFGVTSWRRSPQLKNKSFPTFALFEEKVRVPKVKEGAVEGK